MLHGTNAWLDQEGKMQLHMRRRVQSSRYSAGGLVSQAHLCTPARAVYNGLAHIGSPGNQMAELTAPQAPEQWDCGAGDSTANENNENSAIENGIWRGLLVLSCRGRGIEDRRNAL